MIYRYVAIPRSDRRIPDAEWWAGVPQPPARPRPTIWGRSRLGRTVLDVYAGTAHCVVAADTPAQAIGLLRTALDKAQALHTETAGG